MKKIIIILLLIISCTISPVFAAPQESIPETEKTLDNCIKETISELIEVASNEVGYLEKASNSNLYDKTTNAGSTNYTKYANDLDSWNFYQGKKQGLYWCDVFVDWCFYAAFGLEMAKQMTYQNPYGSAGCSLSANYFQSAGQFYSDPKPGDQIFFGGTHTGLVYKVDGNTVYTIEGNTSSGSGIIANGGSVQMKSYSLNSSRITGYGRPNYLLIAEKKKAEYDYLLQKQKEEEQKQKVLSILTNKEFIMQ